MDLEKTIMTLSNADGVSGNEMNAAKLCLEMLKEFTDDCYIKNGNVIAHINKKDDKKKTLLLDAHIDEIGFIVTSVEEDGFIKVSNCGSIDVRLLSGQNVIIHGKEKVKGVFCSVPPHLSKGESKALKITDMSVDTGLSYGEVIQIISAGDTFSFDVKAKKLYGDRITGKSLDNRSGAAAVLYALSLLKDNELPVNLTVMFSVQEELGTRGAEIGAFDIDPDYAIAVDVSFALSQGENENECKELSKGVMIGISPSLSKELSNIAIKTAELNNIPYQIEVMAGKTGTNADKFSVNRGGVKALTLSLPLKYMHTPVEIISLSDVKNTGELICEMVKRGLE